MRNSVLRENNERRNMKVYLTEQSAKISLSEEEVQSLVEGKEVIGSPDTEFLSPFGERIVIVAKEESPEEGPKPT